MMYALETAKDMHWNYPLLRDREWFGWIAVALSAGVNSIYLSRANLGIAFMITVDKYIRWQRVRRGMWRGVMKLLNRYGWQAISESADSLSRQFTLMARQVVSVKDVEEGQHFQRLCGPINKLRKSVRFVQHQMTHAVTEEAKAFIFTMDLRYLKPKNGHFFSKKGTPNGFMWLI